MSQASGRAGVIATEAGKTPPPRVVDVDALYADLDERGYAVATDLLPREELVAVTEELLALDLAPGPGGDSSCFANLSPSHWPPLEAMATHPVVMTVAERELGSGFKMIGDIGRLVARPGGEPQSFHSDLPVSGWWPRNGRPFPDDNAGLQTIWALTDFTADNGATSVVPFTHTRGRPPRTGVDYNGFARCLEMPAGSVAFLHCALWHRKGRNMTGVDRVGISIPYVAQWLDPVTTWHNPMPRSVWEQMPPRIQELNPHTIEDERVGELHRLHR